MKRLLYIYWSLIFAVGVALLAACLDPVASTEQRTLVLRFEAQPFVNLFTFWGLWVCVAAASFGIFWANKAWRDNPNGWNDTDKMVIIWYLMNACWFHTGCDVLSGLLQVMPNITESYAVSNAVHHHPRYHESRAFLDSVYWLEILIEVPLCIAVYQLSLKRSVWAHPIEIALCAFHFAGTITFYVPNILTGVVTNPVVSNLDRVVGAVWMVVPTILAIRSMRIIKAQIEEGTPPFNWRQARPARVAAYKA
jgi:hypothetical protein